jgi:DNA-3-methyladenine glycosylase I
VPVHDDRTLFEFLILEGAQAGLSWITILRRREGYRKAYDGFDPKKVAKHDARRRAAHLKDPGIIRNRAKIAAATENAKAFLAIQKEFGSFDKYVWGFTGGKTIVREKGAPYRATSPESDALSKDLKKRGFNFVGSTIMYAFLQACGLVDDHADDCWRRKR